MCRPGRLSKCCLSTCNFLKKISRSATKKWFAAPTTHFAAPKRFHLRRTIHSTPVITPLIIERAGQEPNSPKKSQESSLSLDLGLVNFLTGSIFALHFHCYLFTLFNRFGFNYCIKKL